MRLKKITAFLLALALLLPCRLPAAARTVGGEELLAAALSILYTNEGSFASVNRDDNGAVSVGKIQWHGNRALALLRDILNRDPEAGLALVGDALYEEIMTSPGWSGRIVSPEEAAALSRLLSSPAGMAVQNAQGSTDVSAYLAHGKNLGLKDSAALVYFADLENQGGTGMSARVSRCAAAKAGSFDQVNLGSLHRAALEDGVAGLYASRRMRTYEYCLSLGWSDAGAASLRLSLRRGSSGSEVLRLQTMLNAIDNASLAPDGSFDAATETALISFQRRHGLPPDGVCGENTRCALEEDYGKLSPWVLPSSLMLSGEAVSLEPGRQLRLTATVYPAAAANKNLFFASENPQIASVNAAGLITAVSPGSTRICVRTEAGQKQAWCRVFVLAPQPAAAPQAEEEPESSGEATAAVGGGPLVQQCF